MLEQHLAPLQDMGRKTKLFFNNDTERSVFDTFGFTPETHTHLLLTLDTLRTQEGHAIDSNVRARRICFVKHNLYAIAEVKTCLDDNSRIGPWRHHYVVVAIRRHGSFPVRAVQLWWGSGYIASSSGNTRTWGVFIVQPRDPAIVRSLQLFNRFQARKVLNDTQVRFLSLFDLRSGQETVIDGKRK